MLGRRLRLVVMGTLIVTGAIVDLLWRKWLRRGVGMVMGVVMTVVVTVVMSVR